MLTFSNLLIEKSEEKGTPDEKGVSASSMDEISKKNLDSDHKKQENATQSKKSLDSAFKSGKDVYEKIPKGPEK